MMDEKVFDDISKEGLCDLINKLTKGFYTRLCMSLINGLMAIITDYTSNGRQFGLFLE